MPLFDGNKHFIAITGEEEQFDKVVKFDKGPIEAIGFKLNLDAVKPRARESAGTIVLFTRDGSQLDSRLYGIILSRGWPDEKQLNYIPLDYDARPERQLRKIVNRLEQDGLITTEQREQAYKELGLGEDLYNRPTKEGRVF
jgi:hypothetical protein